MRTLHTKRTIKWSGKTKMVGSFSQLIAAMCVVGTLSSPFANQSSTSPSCQALRASAENCGPVLGMSQVADLANAATNIPGLTILESPNTTAVVAAGQIVTNTFSVTNVGDVALADVVVTDVLGVGNGAITTPVCLSLQNPTADCSGDSTSIAPGQAAQFVDSYVVTQADMDAGIDLMDSSTATGLPPTGPPYTSPIPGVGEESIVQNLGLNVSKSGEPDVVDFVGQVITYKFFATNIGNVTLNSAGIDDIQVSPSADILVGVPRCVTLLNPVKQCQGVESNLDPGQSEQYVANLVVSQRDLDNGQIVDSASAVAMPPTGPQYVSPEQAVFKVNVRQFPHLTILATARIAYFTKPKQSIEYDFLIANEGNVTLHHIRVASNLVGLSRITCESGVLAPREAETCTAHYTTTVADLRIGEVQLIAVASGLTPQSANVLAQSGVSVPAIKKNVQVTG